MAGSAYAVTLNFKAISCKNVQRKKAVRVQQRRNKVDRDKFFAQEFWRKMLTKGLVGCENLDSPVVITKPAINRSVI